MTDSYAQRPLPMAVPITDGAHDSAAKRTGLPASLDAQGLEPTNPILAGSCTRQPRSRDHAWLGVRLKRAGGRHLRATILQKVIFKVAAPSRPVTFWPKLSIPKLPPIVAFAITEAGNLYVAPNPTCRTGGANQGLTRKEVRGHRHRHGFQRIPTE